VLESTFVALRMRSVAGRGCTVVEELEEVVTEKRYSVADWKAR
jgi:hypothetical protein